jgi:hypothetical protein
MEQIATLFVQDEKGNTVGKFVVDMEQIVAMYHERMYRFLNDKQQADKDRLPITTPVMIDRLNHELAWYEDPDGSIALRHIPPNER